MQDAAEAAMKSRGSPLPLQCLHVEPSVSLRDLLDAGMAGLAATAPAQGRDDDVPTAWVQDLLTNAPAAMVACVEVGRRAQTLLCPPSTALSHRRFFTTKPRHTFHFPLSLAIPQSHLAEPRDGPLSAGRGAPGRSRGHGGCRFDSRVRCLRCRVPPRASRGGRAFRRPPPGPGRPRRLAHPELHAREAQVRGQLCQSLQHC